MLKITLYLLFLLVGLFFYFFLSYLGVFESFGEVQWPKQELSWKGWFTVAVVLTALVCLVKEVWPPDVVMLISAGILTVGGAISPQELLQGFSRDIIVTLAMLCIIVRTFEVNGILNQVTNRILPKSTSMIKGMVSLLVPVSTLSAFLNNTVVVLMMTPITRKWALDNNFSPSKFLIPISYASIVGGMCTLIGTSTNLIVDGLLREQNLKAGFGFFELALIGVPICFLVIGFISLIGHYLLPVREDVTTAVTRQAKDFTAEFDVTEECPLVGQLVKDVSGKYFHGELLVEIERDGRHISVPGPYEVILLSDRLIFAGDIDQIAEIHTIEGLKSCADPHFQIKESSTHFSEIVISINSILVGKTLRRVNFRNNYGASVLAIYREGKRVMGNVGDIVIEPGDTLMLLHGETWHGERYHRDFYYISHSEILTIFRPWRAALVSCIGISMIALALFGVPIMIAVMFAALACILTRSITLREAQRSIIWSVLLLIASSFAVATAVQTTGVANYLAELLLSLLGTNPHILIGGMLLITSLFTEIISNNAAALLIFPIVLKAVHLAGYSGISAIKTVGVAIAVGASCGFALPTGYQTNMIVYGPGGYRMRDFLIIGMILNVLIIVLAVFLIPTIWPLS